MRNLIIIIAILLTFIGGWAAWRHHSFNQSKIVRNANVEDYESNMTEALVRQMIPDLPKEKANAIFLAFGEQLTSPSGRFISRFRDVRPPVKSFKAASMPVNGMIIDTSTGRVGLLIQIVKVKPFVAAEFEVEVAVSKAGAGWDHFCYHIVNLGGDWKVRSRKAT
jgi:hypothetical protein